MGTLRGVSRSVEVAPELPPNRDALGWTVIVGSVLGGALILWTPPSTDG